MALPAKDIYCADTRNLAVAFGAGEQVRFETGMSETGVLAPVVVTAQNSGFNTACEGRSSLPSPVNYHDRSIRT